MRSLCKTFQRTEAYGNVRGREELKIRQIKRAKKRREHETWNGKESATP